MIEQPKQLKLTCLSIDCPERTGGRCTAGDDMAKKMQRKSYRFYWFCRVSWGYQQGQRWSALRRFWGAWRSFNKACVEDQKNV